MYQLVYSSRPFGFDISTLNNLLLDSRENNVRNELTGALICRSDLYLQLLEGPKKNVLKTFDKIKLDDRHVEVNILISKDTNQRIFPNWAMKDDPVRSWMWSREQVANGEVLTTSPEKILNVFNRISIGIIY